MGGEHTDYATAKRINQLLTTVYGDIVRVEELASGRASSKIFPIKEVHAVDAISMYEHKPRRRWPVNYGSRLGR